jgi:hypothetical protein
MARITPRGTENASMGEPKLTLIQGSWPLWLAATWSCAAAWAGLDGVLAWTKIRLSNGAVEGINNKIKAISHRSFGFRNARNFIAAVYHCCARLPLPVER